MLALLSYEAPFGAALLNRSLCVVDKTVILSLEVKMSIFEIETLIREEQDRTSGCFIEKEKIEEYIEKLKINAEILSHHVRGSCAGFVAFYCNADDKKLAFITLVLVSPEFRGLKISKCLVSAVLSLARARGFSQCALEVKAGNQSAISLYKELGFTISSFSQNTLFMTTPLKS